MILSMKPSRRGIALMTALLMVVVVAMLTRAIIALGPGTLTLVDARAYQAEARKAAESGVAYATTRLRENPRWRGDGGGGGKLPHLLRAGAARQRDRPHYWSRRSQESVPPQVQLPGRKAEAVTTSKIR